jgi:hypothetical protein
VVFVSLAEVVEVYVLILIFHIHHAVVRITHVLLAVARFLKLLGTEKTKVANLDPGGHVGEHTFQIDETVYI